MAFKVTVLSPYDGWMGNIDAIIMQDHKAITEEPKEDFYFKAKHAIFIIHNDDSNRLEAEVFTISEMEIIKEYDYFNVYTKDDINIVTFNAEEIKNLNNLIERENNQ